MTFFPLAETLQGDITGYICSNLVSMTDGQIYLNAGLFQEGFKPAIDLELSVSRIGSKVQCPGIRNLSEGLRYEYVQYRSLLRLTRLRTKLSPEAAQQLQRGRALYELLIQENGFQFRNSSRQPFPMTGCKMMKSKSPSRKFLIRNATKNPSRLDWNNCMAKVPRGNCRNLALESSVAPELDRPQSNVLPAPASASL